MVLDMITRFRREGEADVGTGGSDSGGTGTAPPEPEIDTLILLDRGVDVVSPLVTPLTFEALVDQVFHIDSGAWLAIGVLMTLFALHKADLCWAHSDDGDSQSHGWQGRSIVTCEIKGSNRKRQQARRGNGLGVLLD